MSVQACNDIVSPGLSTRAASESERIGRHGNKLKNCSWFASRGLVARSFTPPYACCGASPNKEKLDRNGEKFHHGLLGCPRDLSGHASLEFRSSLPPFDRQHGLVLQKIEQMGQTNNTIVVFTTDNGAETITFPD